MKSQLSFSTLFTALAAVAAAAFLGLCLPELAVTAGPSSAITTTATAPARVVQLERVVVQSPRSPVKQTQAAV